MLRHKASACPPPTSGPAAWSRRGQPPPRGQLGERVMARRRLNVQTIGRGVPALSSAHARLTRRGALGALAAAAAATATAGCVRTGGHRRPSAAASAVQLTFMPWWPYWNDTGKALLQDQCTQFEAAHPGIRLHPLPGPNGGGADGNAVVTSLLTGTGPDVVCDDQERWPAYAESGAFADLGPYLRRDGLDTTVWSPSHMAVLRNDSGQLALPTYDGPMVFAYRQDIMDALGVAYPDPDWTYDQAAMLWRQCTDRRTGPGRLPRYGATVWWDRQRWRGSNWLLTGFGGAEMDASGTRALFDDAHSIAAGEWLLPLVWEGVVGGWGDAAPDAGNTVFSPRGGWQVLHDATVFGTHFKWDYIPSPVFPRGRATFGNDDYWGLSAASRFPEQAWLLMKWLTYEGGWQRFCMKTALLPPCTSALWDEWEQTVTQVVPLLKGKKLQWFKDAAQGGYGYPQQFFRYSAVQADAIISGQIALLNAQRVDVARAFGTISDQINALEAADRPAPGIG